MKEYTDDKIQIVNGDFLNYNFFPSYVDLTVTSPPYNLNMGYDSVDDLLPYFDYLGWTKEWLTHLYHITADSGRLCLNIPIDVFNYDQKNTPGERIPLGSDLVTLAMNVGWNYKVTISWDKKNIASRTAWGSFMSPSAPHLNNPVENIVVFYKGDNWKRNKKGETDILKKEFVDWTYGLWEIPAESQGKTWKVNHPAPYPVELPYRCIKLFSYKDDLIFDPFLGSGSTMIAAKSLNRKGLGIEISQKYVALIINRLRNDKFLKTPTPTPNVEEFL